MLCSLLAASSNMYQRKETAWKQKADLHAKSGLPGTFYLVEQYNA